MKKKPTDLPERSPLHAAARVVLIYAVFASLWIGLSDEVLSVWVSDPAQIIRLSSLKGWLFVAATSLLLFGLIRRLLGQMLAAAQRERAAQAEIQRSQLLLTALIDSSSDAIFAKDLAGRYLLFNPETTRITGKGAEQALGHDDTALFPPEQAEIIRTNDCRVIDLNQTTSYEETLQTIDGERVFLATKGPLRDGNGQVIGLFGISRDITERKAQEQQLQLAAQVFAQSREGIIVTDAQGDILMVNRAFTEITGYNEAQALGRNPRILKSDRQSAAFYLDMWAALTATGHWAGEIWNRHQSGTLYPEWLAISALRDGHDQTTHYVASFTDLSSTKAAESRIQWLSHFDPITGLANRTLLQDRCEQSIAMVQRAGEPLTLLMASIDNFKAINDILGHQAGDAILNEMAKRLSATVRDQDTVAHLSGKDFVLVLPGTPSGGAAHLAAQLLWKLAQPYDLGDQETNLSASIGIASYPDNGLDFAQLLNSAEVAMHTAQAKGRDSFAFYSADLYVQVLAHDHMIKALRQAITLDQLQLLYQPQVDLQSGRICGMEALLRWQHPELGAVSPAQFIPLAEESGLIIGIGEWVLRRACQDIRRWLDHGIKVPHVAVNASPLQFRDNNLVEQVQAALAESQIDPTLIYIEVTESALMDDVPQSEAMLRSLKELGIKLSLDDFGTGYSSLSYLKRFPFDQVKIDQSFVRDVATNPSDTMLVKVIVSMAHGFGMKVIAEGVETEAQCAILSSSACDEIQGYFFSRPISAQAMEELLGQARQLPAHLRR
ncbi:EAL domain-containing protein [Rhodoferax sp.]|uniref:putative bifunctional diguanylate cyclase/phosphodiesterase n=1 Tax=Rhodoferax sp. TaxID=50421 RepID=UPI001ED33F55|nr:EAL domain-containing protein [Rhodoferax sp.]MBU4018465.1 EAL domain-containing protein [Gammaproteobacteria bacterium]MBU4114416.1 EAL domain-containing protein [Gammaproteobacteria bacterium]MBU4170308.1 EAL domain-containing protein [Gammaproteobacteria bacterium]